MCSIAGYLRTGAAADNVRLLRAMNRALARRGPDDAGLLVADGAPRGKCTDVRPDHHRLEHRLGLAHNRLSILDLSPAGHQPFSSPDGRHSLIFNGEIYNHAELRPELENLGWRFRSASDTEVFLAAVSTWRDRCFDRLDGFWAAAIWDNHRAELTLSRDRFGEAPLFYLWHDGGFYFASEIVALQEVVGWSGRHVSDQAVTDYLYHGISDVGNKTFFDGIEQLPQATFARVTLSKQMTIEPYWTFPQPRLTPGQIPIPDAIERTRSTLAAAAERQMHADVPVGFQLSGGMDSSALVAMVASTGRKVSAYTVSYPGTPHDELPFAQSVADRYPGLIDLHELRAPGDEFWAAADDVVSRYGEPFGGPNTYCAELVWRAMRDRGIKVVINGGGGDELFDGYRRDYHAPYLRELLLAGRLGRAIRESAQLSEDPVPVLSRRNASRILAALNSRHPLTPDGHVAISTPGAATHHLPVSLFPIRRAYGPQREPLGNLDEKVRNLLSHWRLAHHVKNANIASLSVPVELRFPFFDRRVAELALTLPHEYLIRDGWMKWVLRKAIEPYLPGQVTWRKKKMGFPFPYSTWAHRSKAAYLRAIADTRCPYVDHDHLVAVWDDLARLNPIFLWRCMSLTMWWRRCVEGIPLGEPRRLPLAA
jgi:asparagine synthase (glutamine-hydrolysing)